MLCLSRAPNKKGGFQRDMGMALLFACGQVAPDQHCCQELSCPVSVPISIRGTCIKPREGVRGMTDLFLVA